MFGLVPFGTHHANKEGNPFDDLMSVFDEPFFQSFGGLRAQDFKVDVRDNGDSYDLMAELPGLEKDEISLSYKDNYLTIAANKQESSDEKDDKGSYVRRERSTSSMSRSFYIDNIDETQATADYKDGVLTVHLPKVTKTEPAGHTININ